MTLEVNWVVGSMLSVFVIFPAVMAAVVILSLNSFRQAGIVGLVGLAINEAVIILSALKADKRTGPGAVDSDVVALDLQRLAS